MIANMKTRREGTQTIFARSVSAEIRARMAAIRMSGAQVAAKAGMSQNYFATRLRDEKPFTLDDLDKIVEVLFDHNLETHVFAAQAYDRNSEDIWMELEGPGVSDLGYTLAASDADIDSEIEAQQQEP